MKVLNARPFVVENPSKELVDVIAFLVPDNILIIHCDDPIFNNRFGTSDVYIEYDSLNLNDWKTENQTNTFLETIYYKLKEIIGK